MRSPTKRWTRSCDGTWWRDLGPFTAFVDTSFGRSGRLWEVHYHNRQVVDSGWAPTLVEARKAAGLSLRELVKQVSK